MDRRSTLVLAALGALAVALAALGAGCEGIADIPDDTIICCQTLDQVATMRRLDCVWNPEGRVVEYARCPDAGPEDGGSSEE